MRRKETERASSETPADPKNIAAQNMSPCATASAPTARSEQTAATGRPLDARALLQRNEVSDQQRPVAVPKSDISDARRSDMPSAREMIDGIDARLYNDLIREIGRPARRRKKINVILAEKMHNAGFSYAQVGRHFKCSGCTIRRRIEEAKRRRLNRTG